MLDRRQQLIALVRKNYVIQLRSKKELAIMIFLPALFMMVFAILRATELQLKEYKEKYAQPQYELWKSLCLAPNNLELLYAPRNEIIDSLMQNVYNQINSEYETIKIFCDGRREVGPSFFTHLKDFHKEKDLEDHVVKNFENIFAGIIFFDPQNEKNEFSSKQVPNQWRYKIRMKGADLPDTSMTFQEFEVGPTDSGLLYFQSGFPYLQTIIDNEIYKNTGNSLIETVVSVEQFPFPKYTDTLFYQVIGDALSFYVCLGFLVFVIKLISRLVVEKEKKIKETMKIMGLSDTVFWLSWFVYAFSIMFVTMLLLAFVVKVGLVFEKSDFGLIFIFFQLWGVSIICFCFLISVFFNKSKVASALGAVILFLALLPNISVKSDSPPGDQYGACLLSPACLALGLEKFADYEEAQEGITASNMYDGDFNFASVLTMLLIDIGIYSFMAWYLDQVLPREYGIRRSWYFLLQPSYWGLVIRENTVRSDGTSIENDNDPNSEHVPPELQARLSVQIRGLEKKFTVGSGKNAKKKTAVDKLDLCMYEGQIMSLLGHNGAGKTTTVSMLTGFFPPSGGDAIIYGMSIHDKMERIRENIGLCSQYNVLWDELTVEEHLYLFAALKGVPQSEIKKHVEERIKDVGLEEKSQSLSKDLSGGQKRKLCVAIAFTGGTKIIFLDEPTSGMDPFSRRAIWSLLQRLKDNRTIILTTHFMDEADLLGDRIAIMNHGKLAACGSSLFLKSRFGVGYTLTVVKKPQCTERNVTGYLMQYSPEIRLLSNVGAELSYVIPLSSSHTFGRLFSAFEQSKESLQVDSYGISVTTLEEVFLRIANSGVEEQPRNPQNTSTNGQFSMTVRDLDERIRNAQAKIYDPTIQYVRSSLRQFYALLSKRFLVSRRDSRALFQMLFYPSLFILFAVIASKSRPSGRNETEYLLAHNKYGMNVNIFASNNGTLFDLEDYLSLSPNQVNSWWDQWSNINNAAVSEFTNDTLRCALLACQLPNVKAKLDDPVTNQQMIEKYNRCLTDHAPGWKSNGTAFDASDCEGLHSAVSFADKSESSVTYTVFFDTTAYHSLPTAINFVSNAIIRERTGDKNSYIMTINHPLPDPEFVGEDYGRSFSLSLYVGIALCIIPGALITSVMRERETKAAHQQLVCGVDSKMLWATYLLSDMALFMVAIVLFFLIFAGTRTDAFIGENFVATLILFIVYGFAVFPCTYAISFYIKSSTSAQSRITAGYVSLSLAALIVISVLYAIPSTTDYAEPIDYIFTLIPTYAVAIGVFYISLNELAKSVPGEVVRDPMHWKVAGRPITFLVIEAVLFMALVYFLQTGMVEELYFKYIKKKEDRREDEVEMEEAEDIDVKNERARIETSNQPADAVYVKNLRKVYHGSVETKIAVKNLSFGIPEGECFGLLGPNGAGKTTTLSMLAGDFPPTSGDIHLRGYDMISEKLKAFKHISLCPQVDPLLDLMTGREHMILFGALKGIPEDKIHQVVQHTLDMLGLAEHADKRSMTYSGGNKRKLALGIALLGDPKVIFLDEPSTGMDPGARRFMWDVISNFLPGRSIILTTHSMEECEALCTRIGIVVNGYLKCIGSSQHLKSRFGGGYRLDLQCAWSSVPEVKEYITNLFPTANLLEWHGGKLRYEIPRADLDLGKVFDEIEQNRKRLQILDYALSQTTLEQVFINFARTQLDEHH